MSGSVLGLCRISFWKTGATGVCENNGHHLGTNRTIFLEGPLFQPSIHSTYIFTYLPFHLLYLSYLPCSLTFSKGGPLRKCSNDMLDHCEEPHVAICVPTRNIHCETCESERTSLLTYICYVCVYTCVYVCIHIYIYIYGSLWRWLLFSHDPRISQEASISVSCYQADVLCFVQVSGVNIIIQQYI